MAKLLGQVAVGSIVKLKENGSFVDFYVAKHDYESGLNGAGRTLVVRKDVYDQRQWNTSSSDVWASCSMLSWLNSTYKALLDSDIQSVMGTTNYYYTLGNGNWTVTNRSDAVFLLSVTELGQSSDYANVEGSALPIASTLQIAYQDGSATQQWTRSAFTNSNRYAWGLRSDGTVLNHASTDAIGSRPAFTLPSTMSISGDGPVIVVPTAPTLTVPSQAMQGQSIPINWTASANADSYQLQRKADSGEWETIYTGSDLTFTDTAGSWSTVQYQVAAGLGGEYGEYVTSAIIPVVSASALVISGTNEDLGTITADIPYTVTSDTGNQITLTRTVNGVQYASATVRSGFAYNIPVMELPTGTGTIVITATVQATSGPVTVTRTWTYTKTAQTFPASAGVGPLAQNGVSFLPQTLAECVRTNPFWGGSLSTALEMLTGVAANGAQVEVGSYTGTDTYGSGNPTSYTFSKIPRIIFIISSATQDGMGVIIPNDSAGFGGKTLDNGWDFWVVNCTGTTVQWYSNGNALKQMNFASYSPYKILAFY